MYQKYLAGARYSLTLHLQTMEKILKKKPVVTSILSEKCPKCREGQIFRKKDYFLQFPKMYDNCPHCGFRFDREPGYFLGAMYFSYALAVLQGIITFLICYFFFPELPTIAIPLIILGVVTIFSYFNYKLSRVIYLYIFSW